MSLLDYINTTKTESPSGSNVNLSEFNLGRTHSNLIKYNLLYTDIIEMFNSYDYTFTLSPKGCDRFKEITPLCNKCHRSQSFYKTTDEQYLLFIDLFTYLHKRYNIDFIAIFEHYSDGQHIHSHGMIKSDSIKSLSMMKNIVEDIYTFFRVPRTNKILVKIEKVKNLDSWSKYLMKDQENPVFHPLMTKPTQNRIVKKVQIPLTHQLILILKKLVKSCECENEEHCLNCKTYFQCLTLIMALGANVKK